MNSVRFKVAKINSVNIHLLNHDIKYIFFYFMICLHFYMVRTMTIHVLMAFGFSFILNLITCVIHYTNCKKMNASTRMATRNKHNFIGFSEFGIRNLSLIERVTKLSNMNENKTIVFLLFSS